MWIKWEIRTTDRPEFRYAATKAGVPLPFVIAVWCRLMEHAATATPRGDVSGFDPDLCDVALGLGGNTGNILTHLFEKLPLDEGKYLHGWQETQTLAAAPKSSTERSRACRARKAAASHNEPQRAATTCNDTQHHATLHNAAQRCATGDKEKEEEKEKEEIHKDTTPLPPFRGAKDNCVCGEKPASKNVPAKKRTILTPTGSQPDPLPLDNRTIEFIELRAAWDQYRAEGETAGLAEYNAIRKTPAWPGLTVLLRAADNLAAHDDSWKRGFAPGLARFLRDRGWTAKPRIAPQPAAKGLTDSRIQATLSRQLEKYA